ncbi:hypothetical protein H9Q74_000048 [Fusarium xylarioides]|nr:hypothetical protein H9Q74_000048 [Fusarium xylarioides]
MSLSIALKSSDIDPFDEDARRLWIIIYLKAEGVYRESSQESSYEQRVEEVAKSISDHDRFTRVGHLYFEYHVDKAMWQKTFGNHGHDTTPKWPWSHSPNPNDMSQGLSQMYRQWRIDHRLPVDLAECMDPLLNSTETEPALAMRQEIWDVVYPNKPFNDVVVGPFKLHLPKGIDFRHLILGEGNEVYDKVCRLIGPQFDLTWAIIDNNGSYLIVSVNTMYDVCKNPLFVHLDLLRLWRHVLQWLKDVKQGRYVTIADHLEAAIVAEISLAQSGDFDV